jgi:serine/threonine protein kinase/tetratricopeptide (TPR) repeat protein
MATDPKLVRDMFHAAVELPAAERTAYLSNKCDDPDVRAAVERLLAAHDEPASLLNRPAPGIPTGVYAPIAERVGTMIGPYKLMEQVGEGGFGLVFVAEQQEPVKRKVALKIIKPGMDSRQVIARFEAEKQALALMDHPNIAKVFDAGSTETGRPYFVMELVRGIPITDYCDKNQLPPKDRLDLFVSVCHAIQHAHQKGIIHRDVKPSNVLVTSHDGKPVAKVIDFGVAKAIHQKLSAHSVYTNFAQMVGTPLYMSPEQAEMSGLDIDTRSDVYSLGVLLYELLTGTTPLEKKRLAQAAYDEIRRLIREEEPPKPSTRLSSSDSLASIAARRQTEPAKLSRLVRGDLDWITMKALEKDRTRRYETASGLARDIQRYLSDEPVEACPPSATYRLRKFARKNRAALATAAALAFLLLAGITVSTWQAVRATEERTKAETAKKEAEAKEAEANAVVQFFEDKVFAAGRPKGEAGGLGHDVPLRDAIKASLTALGTSFRDQPLVEARLRYTLGTTFSYLGDPPSAAEQLEQARALFARHRGPDHPNTLMSMNNLANTFNAMNRHAEALKLQEEALAAQKRVLGPDHPDTLRSMHNSAVSYAGLKRYADAIERLEETVAARKRVLGPDDRETLSSMNNLAGSYNALNRHAEALKLQEETLAAQKRVLPPDHPDTLRTMHNLANSYSGLNRLAESLNMLEQTVAGRKRVLPPDHLDTFKSMHNLAFRYFVLERHPEALKLLEETVAGRKRVLPPDHPDTLASMQNLVASYTAVGRLAEALKLNEETLAAQKRILPPDHRDTLRSMMMLANIYMAMERHAEALKLNEQTLAVQKRVLPPDDPETLKTMNNLAAGYAALNHHAEALKLNEETLAIRKRVLSVDHPDTLASRMNVASNYEALNRHAEALKLNEENLVAQKRVLGPDHPDTLTSMENLSGNYAALNRYAEALQLREETVAASKRVLGPDHPNTLSSMNNLANIYAFVRRHAEALKLREETLAARRRVLRVDHPNTLWSMTNLADSYVALNRHAEALPLLNEVLAKANRPGFDPVMFSTAIGLRLQCCQKVGDVAGCRASAEMLEKRNPTDAVDIYDTACGRAITALVQARSKEPDAARLAKGEADKAMAWLRKAVAAGWKEAAHMKKDTDLDILRDRDDFKKLMADLEKTSAKK